jgi:hypothetical protein
MQLIRDFVAGRVAFYDEPSPPLAKILQTLGAAYEQFSFL